MAQVGNYNGMAVREGPDGQLYTQGGLGSVRRNVYKDASGNISETKPAMSLKDAMSLEDHKANIKLTQDTASAKQGYGPDGRPLDINFDSQIDPATGMLDSKYRLDARPDVTADQRAMDAIRNRGLAQGPSDWAKASLDKQGLEQSSAMDNLRQQGAGLQRQTLAALMQNVGLSSGSRERIAGRSLREQMMGGQVVFRQGQMDRANIGVQDENFKTDALKSTVANDFQNAGLGIQNRNYQTEIQGKNLSAAMNEINARRGFDMDKYKSKMQEWGAGKTADAQRAASGGGKK